MDVVLRCQKVWNHEHFYERINGKFANIYETENAVKKSRRIVGRTFWVKLGEKVVEISQPKHDVFVVEFCRSRFRHFIAEEFLFGFWP